MPVPFNRPFLFPDTRDNLNKVLETRKMCGNGPFTNACSAELAKLQGPRCAGVLLTHSCTAALEMAAMLVLPGPDELGGEPCEFIVPSYTFVSSATAFLRCGARPVFVDVSLDDVNVTAEAIEAAITPRTRAICVVHYGGVACDMDKICALAKRHGIFVIEDAAHAIYGSYNGVPCGSLADLAAFSFHETKNIHCGEGGALVVNNKELMDRAEIIQEKGTNRKQWERRGRIQKYHWCDMGSSFPPGEMNAALLLSQLNRGHEITANRCATWATYHAALEPLERRGLLRRPRVRAGARHPAHNYWFLTNSSEDLAKILAVAKERKIGICQHYVPLHSSPYGQRVGRAVGSMANTNRIGDTLLRLPLWFQIPTDAVRDVVRCVYDAYGVEMPKL